MGEVELRVMGSTGDMGSSQGECGGEDEGEGEVSGEV